MKKTIARSGILCITIAVGFMVVGIFFLSPATKVSGEQQPRGWRVWVRSSPCSGRFDWLSVAQNNPGVGSSYYFSYETILANQGCTESEPNGCTFAEATALMESLRDSSKFADFCCRDYSVWKNTQTGKMTIVLGKQGTAGMGWSYVKGNLCCEEAEDIAGIPGACSGKKSGAKWGATNHNAGLNGKTLKFYGATTPEQCQADCEKNPQCKGFTFMRAGAHSSTDPKMCYLMSEATSFAPSSCCISAIKSQK